MYTGPYGGITALALSPDEMLIVSSDESGRVIVWDVASARPLFTLAGGGSATSAEKINVTSLDWRSDNGLIVAGRIDGTVQIWPLPSGR